MNMPLDSMKGVIKQEVPPSGSQWGSFMRQIFMQSSALKLLESWKGRYYKKCFWCYTKRNRNLERLWRTIRAMVSEYKCKFLFFLLVFGKSDQTEHMVKWLKQFRICCMAQWLNKITASIKCCAETAFVFHKNDTPATLVHHTFCTILSGSSGIDI